MKQLKLLLAFGLIVLFFSCNEDKKYPYVSTDFRPELKAQLDKIALATVLPDQPDTAITHFLYNDCSKKELVKLLAFDGPVVRVMAYEALLKRREKDFFSILMHHLDDTAKITWWYCNDAADQFMVSDIMIQLANPGIETKQKQKIVEKVLLKCPYLVTSNWMIQDIEPNERYYSIIKSRATEKSDRCGYPMGANFALSKFRKPKDVLFLKNNFLKGDEVCIDWTFRAIECFPDTSFYDVLIRYFAKNVKRKKQFASDDLAFYCRAVAVYKNVESLKILTDLTKKETYPYDYYLSYNKEAVFKAILKHKCPLYKKLYEELKPQMTEYFLDNLEDLEYEEWKSW